MAFFRQNFILESDIQGKSNSFGASTGRINKLVFMPTQQLEWQGENELQKGLKKY